MQFELVEKQLELGLWLGITRKDYGATITGGQINVDHLHGAELLKHCTGSESGSQVSQAAPQGDMKTVGDKGDKDVCLNSMGKLMKNGANA